MEKGDYSLLAKDPYSNFSKDVGREILESVWGNIYKEYCEMTNDNRALEYYRLKTDLVYLETRRHVAGKLFAQISMRNMKRELFMEYIKELREWKFKYKKNRKVLTEMEDLGRQIRATGNRINMTRAKLESFDNSKKPVSLEKQVLKVEQALGKNQIDPKDTSVTRWVFMFEHIAELNTERKKRNVRK